MGTLTLLAQGLMVVTLLQDVQESVGLSRMQEFWPSTRCICHGRLGTFHITFGTLCGYELVIGQYWPCQPQCASKCWHLPYSVAPSSTWWTPVRSLVLDNTL